MKKTVLITGGAGFIGSHLTRKLLANKYKVICVDNLSSFYNPKIKIKNIEEFKKNKSYYFYKTSILDTNQIKKFIKRHKIDIIIHLAAQPGTRLSFVKPLLYEKTNIAGTYKMLDLGKNLGIKQFVFASSSSVYGNAKIPFDEDESTTKPISLYGATKLAGEQACYAYHKNFHLPITILRFFSVYGPNGRPDMAPYLFTKALYSNKKINVFGDGSSSRDWTYIDDIIEGIYKVIKKPFSFEIINLGNSKPVKLSEMISLIEETSGKQFKKRASPPRNDEPNITSANINKARKLLDWKPATDFKEGIRKFIIWFNEGRV